MLGSKEQPIALQCLLPAALHNNKSITYTVVLYTNAFTATANPEM